MIALVLGVMLAATLDLGEGFVAVAISLVTLGTLIVNNMSTRNVRQAAEKTEEHTDGIGPALHRLEIGQALILSRLDDHERRIGRLEGDRAS